jgi:hypothetical protein
MPEKTENVDSDAQVERKSVVPFGRKDLLDFNMFQSSGL